MIDFNEIFPTNHRGFLFDLDYKQYFHMKPSTYDKSESRKLNSSNRKHRIAFKEKLEEYIEKMGLMEKATRICNNHVTIKELNMLDDAITYVLSAARKYIEGVQRNVPYSKVKQIKESTLKYLRVLINKKRGKRIDEGVLKRRKEYCKLDLEMEDLPVLVSRYEEVVEDWTVFKSNQLKEKEEKLLELYLTEIIGDSEEALKQRKKALRSIKMKKFQENTFSKLTKGVGKGEKKSLVTVREVNAEGEIVKEH